ncbi:hypothetical protein VSR34_39365, partial [Paraburkholderia sp. JHI2823]
MVVSINHPQSSLADFYREMGDIFNLELKAHNRWGGFRSLRERMRLPSGSSSSRRSLSVRRVSPASTTHSSGCESKRALAMS